ncbi:MAG: AAA family ATPase, partial [Cyanobacteriota bacterium]
PSVFLSELPADLLQGDVPRTGGAALRREQRIDRLTRIDRQESRQVATGGAAGVPSNAVRRRAVAHSWAVGDQLHHSNFGVGTITHLFGSGEKISLAVKFPGMGPKILDPRLAPIEPLPTPPS